LSCIKDFEYAIDIDEDAVLENKPPPLSTQEQVRAGLDSMLNMGVIKKQQEPTPISNSRVIIKKRGKLRTCNNLIDLNRHIRRRHFLFSTIEEIVTRIIGSKFFTFHDCQRGFWQIKVTSRTE
jgi:hypothetical protein